MEPGDVASNAIRIAILDDYQNIALDYADWSRVVSKADVTVFTDHLSDPGEIVDRLQPFDVLCVMRERTPLPREIIERLPRLKMIASTGPGNASIDEQAAREHNIHITHTGYRSTPTIELTWALILASARNLVGETTSLRGGGWQTSIGRELSGRVLGVLGLGRIGGEMARIGTAFGMDVIAWSQNLIPERARAGGAEWVAKEELFRRSDVLTIHLALSDRTRGLVTAADLAAMKPTSWLVNTSRGPIVDENALIDALTSRSIAGAALDVFDTEPLPAGHPLRTLPNVVATPHIGYVAEDLYRTFYRDAVTNIEAWLETARRSHGGPVTGAATPIQHGDVGYISVWTPDADRAAAFYGHVLGWTYDPQTHQVTNTKQHIGIFSVPGERTLFCCYAVADVAGARQAILDGGGQVGEPEQFDYGTVLDATDPQGTRFAVLGALPSEPRPEFNGSGPGDVSYLSYEVADSTAFRAFYSRVLSWTFQPGRTDDSWQVEQTHPMAGVDGGATQSVTVAMWTVQDIDAAVARVREAGGTIIDEPSQTPYGKSAQCTDDQGTRFYLGAR